MNQKRLTIAFKTYFVWFCIVNLCRVFVWYLAEITTMEFSDNMLFWWRIVNFSIKPLSAIIIALAAVAMYRSLGIGKSKVAKGLFCAIVLLLALFIADRMTGCFTEYYLNTRPLRIDIIPYFLLSTSGMLSMLLLLEIMGNSTICIKSCKIIVLYVIASFCLSTLLPMSGICHGMPIDVLMVLPLGMLLRQIKELNVEECRTEKEIE